MTDRANKAVIVVMPRKSTAWSGAEALWITAAGWASAAQKVFGKSWVVTSDTIASPAEVLHYPLKGNGSQGKGLSRWLPSFLVVALKDVLLWREKRKALQRTYEEPWGKSAVSFVWEQHDLFEGPGHRLSKRLGVPLVTYVHAPVVWEAGKWGVKRPGWGALLERYSEAKALQRADLVLCVSSQVATQLHKMGVEQSRVVISPMSVDTDLFRRSAGKAKTLRQRYNLDGKVVVGWTGSFRNFHALDLLLGAFQQLHNDNKDAALVLVGDGLERKDTEEMCSRLGIRDAVVFAGKKDYSEVPAYLSLFDIAVVSARDSASFHYSPLKLREYLACGVPTLAPNAGDLSLQFGDEKDLLLYTVGDVNDMKNKLSRLVTDEGLRTRLSLSGEKLIRESGTWEVQLRLVMNKLKLN